jgi:hypothetical protein
MVEVACRAATALGRSTVYAHRVDLPVEAFFALRRSFFDVGGEPVPFDLRDKRNTQDDPFDEHTLKVLEENLPGTLIAQSSGKQLVSPDIAIADVERALAVLSAGYAPTTQDCIGLEVKKVERGAGGQVARGSGIDYNSTPPCKTVRVYRIVEGAVVPVDLPGYYLFAVLEPSGNQQSVTAAALVTGGVLNEDFDLYLRIVGIRTKTIDLGSFGDGVDRNRPMMIFANPLGFGELDHAATLVHERHDLETEYPDLRYVGQIHRTHGDGSVSTYHCYRVSQDAGSDLIPFDATDPFPTPARRAATSRRGTFHLVLERGVEVSGEIPPDAENRL